MRIIELGSLVQDTITGFRGIVTSRAIHLNGCDRYWVQPQVGKDMKYADGQWFDVVTLKVLKQNKGLVIEEKEPTERKPGGFPSKIK